MSAQAVINILNVSDPRNAPPLRRLARTPGNIHAHSIPDGRHAHAGSIVSRHPGPELRDERSLERAIGTAGRDERGDKSGPRETDHREANPTRPCFERTEHNEHAGDDQLPQQVPDCKLTREPRREERHRSQETRTPRRPQRHRSERGAP
jgi:hypothetical protein